MRVASRSRLADRVGSTVRRATAAFVVCSAGLSGLVRAGEVTVVEPAALDGDHGLRVVLDVTCTENVAISGGTFQGDSTVACNTLSVGDVTIVGAGATLRSGQVVEFEDGFVLSEGAPLTVIVDPLLASPLAYLEDDSPASEDDYRAHFGLNLDGATLVVGEDVDHLNGYSADGDVQFRAVLRRNDVLPENRLAIFAREPGGSFVTLGTDFLLPAGYNRIELDWRAGAGDGQLLVSVNGAPFSGLEFLNNETSRIDSVRWGAVAGSLSSTSGALDQDTFHSTRPAGGPLDIIVAVDNSGSMDDEVVAVQQSLNNFVSNLTSVGWDVRLILIDSDICVPLPLGTGSCPNDENLPQYRHLLTAVGSTDALQKILDLYPSYSSTLRPGSARAIIVVSDDDSDLPADDFVAELLKLDPDFAGFTAHAIAASEDIGIEPSVCAPNLPAEPFFSQNEGVVYKELVAKRYGVFHDLCLQTLGVGFQEFAGAQRQPIFTDGFESGDVEFWSSQAPD